MTLSKNKGTYNNQSNYKKEAEVESCMEDTEISMLEYQLGNENKGEKYDGTRAMNKGVKIKNQLKTCDDKKN